MASFGNAESVWMYNRLDEVDLFLLDIGLPGLDGIALGRSIRVAPSGRRAVVVAISGGSLHGETEALNAGFGDYILKPLDLDQIKKLLVLASARKQQAAV
ncbi:MULTISPECIES: response regulator [unclassified Duganella]|uniref:response regulator n=1 Tax=unclassified Duganella TaxID=2636909 RepID=UPI0008736B4A|nr:MULTISPECIES: response regulator [unclassified Duganella]